MSAWIRMIPDTEADETLRRELDFARTPHGTVDNVMRVHSLRPATMRGHVVLYRACLHDDGNTLPTWLQEVIASYVSVLNNCDYSYANHWKNARHLIGDDARSDVIENALLRRRPDFAFDGAELALLRYADELTRFPENMSEATVIQLRDCGLDDGEILEANQIICYFNYVNRLLNGLGVTADGDVVGYYSENADGQA
jgi:uncharacterized peroxidase-related enzyme